jgi:hypothetical protein
MFRGAWSQTGYGLVNRFIDHIKHHLELQVITALPLTSTLYKSPQHLLNIFPACCVFNSRSLVMASNSVDSSASHAHVITVWRISHN